jgi:hypothetical protein
MPDSPAMTCWICLQADERDSMALLNRELVPKLPFVELAICRSCAFAIAKVIKATGELPPLPEVQSA